MTITALNETQTTIEEAILAGEHGIRLIQTANQLRSEGNHDGAAAALITASQIQAKMSWTLKDLPTISPEDAELLTKTERLQLATRLSRIHAQVEEMVDKHRRAIPKYERPNLRTSHWYQPCLRIGVIANLVESIANRQTINQHDEELAETTAVTLHKLYNNARASMAEMTRNELPAQAPFPETRARMRQEAQKEFAEIVRINTRFNADEMAIEMDSENTHGQCHICGESLRAEDAGSHVQNCVMETVLGKYRMGRTDERYARSYPIMLWVRSEEHRHWMMLIVQPTTSLRHLDQFLRNQWLECCGHMSHFEIGGVQYSACVPGPGDAPRFDDDLAQPDEQHMVHTIEETVNAGQSFHHEFDYGDTTCLNLKHTGVLPVPYHYLLEFINSPKDSDRYSDDFITIVARNTGPERCRVCGKNAHWRIYSEDAPEGEDPIVAPPFFCDECVPDQKLVRLRNSPRVGVGCYDNTHDEPEAGNSGYSHPEPNHEQIGNATTEEQGAMEPSQVNKIIAWTTPYYLAADERIRQLPDLINSHGDGLESSLAIVEESILQWDKHTVGLLPASWENTTNANSHQYMVVSNTLEFLLEAEEIPKYDHDDECGTPDDALAGIYHRYSMYQEPVSEFVHDDILSVPTRVEHLATDERIVRIIEIAHELMVMSQIAITGVSVHAMAVETKLTTVEAPAPDVLKNAAQTMAYAGAIARAAAKIIDNIIWPLDDE